MMRASACIAAIGVLAGCASVPAPVGEPEAVLESEPGAADPQAQTIAVMLEQARSARLSGRLVEAESTLESALRIAPDDARLWLELAEVQFASGEFDSARTLAQRAVGLSRGDAAVVEAAQRLSAQMAE